MRKDWEVKSLRDVCYFFCDGDWIENKDQSSSGIRLIQTGNIGKGYFRDKTDSYKFITESTFNRLSCKEIFPGDILISRLPDPIGRACIIPSFLKGRFITAVDCTIVRTNELLLPRFFVYYTMSNAYYSRLKIFITGAVRKRISRSNLSKISIPVPPFQTQQQVVEELDCLTSIIEKQKKQLEELDNLAQSIFYDMFGDPIDNEKGWNVKKIKDISLSVNYGTSSPSIDNGKYKYLRMNNITTNGTIDLSSIKYINVSLDDLEKYVVRKGDILFNRTNSKELVGKTALYNFKEDMIIAGYIIRLRVIDSIVLPVFISSYMNTPCVKEYFRSIAKGAVNQSNINSKQLLSTPLYIPPLPLQQQFAAKIEAIEKQKELIKKSIKETEDLFNSRMDYYFN